MCSTSPMSRPNCYLFIPGSYWLLGIMISRAEVEEFMFPLYEVY